MSIVYNSLGLDKEAVKRLIEVEMVSNYKDKNKKKPKYNKVSFRKPLSTVISAL